MSTIKRIVTMRERPEEAGAEKNAATPNEMQCGWHTIRKGEPLEVELDTDTWRGQQQLRAFESEPCVRVEEPEAHKKRVEEERKKAEADRAEAKKRAGSGQGGSGGKSG